MSRRHIVSSLAALVALVATSTVVIAPARDARAAASSGTVALTPHTNVAAIYNEFGINEIDKKTLATVASDLTDEGYQIKEYTDTTEGAGSRGGATLANFVAMGKQASVIVINGHGYDPEASLQSCTGGGKAYDDPAVPAGAVSNDEACATIDEPIVQVEWYPTMEAGIAARRQYVAQGYQDDWFAGPIIVTTTAPIRDGDQVSFENGARQPELGGYRPALFLTASGIKHFFGNKKLDLVDVMACQTMGLAPSFNARTYFGHERTACNSFEQYDEPLLFDRLTGHAGVEARSTTAAFALGGFQDPYFKMAPGSKPVVLSPAVADAAPGDGGGVTGTNTPVSLAFDAKMVRSAPKSVVTAEGCDASIANAKWAGDSRFTLDLKVPKVQPGKTLTLTVHHDAAKSAGGYAHVLDGNQDPGAAGESGVAPNGDDYVLHLSCAPSTKFKMVYSGTYEYTYDQTASGLPPTNETGSYTWTQTQIIEVSSASPNNSSYDSTTTLDASGSASLEGNDLHVSCTIQTPGSYQWVTRRTNSKYTDSTPIGFTWSIASPPKPGTAGATGGGGGAASGCTGNLTGFIESYGLPEPTSHGQQTALDSPQSQVFADALTGSVSFPAGKLPQTKNFDVAGSRTVVEGATNTASLSLHGTLTFSKL